MMFCKVLTVAVMALATCKVKADHHPLHVAQTIETNHDIQARSLLSELSLDVVKPIATGVLNKGLNLFLPSDYNFDSEIDKYIGFAVNIGNTVNAMFKTGIDLFKSAKTKNRAPGALFNPRVYDAALAMGKYGLTLGTLLLHLFTEMLHTIKYAITSFAKLGITLIPRKINQLIFGSKV